MFKYAIYRNRIDYPSKSVFILKWLKWCLFPFVIIFGKKWEMHVFGFVGCYVEVGWFVGAHTEVTVLIALD